VRARSITVAASVAIALLLGACGLPGGGGLRPSFTITPNTVTGSFTYLTPPGGTFTNAPITFTVKNTGFGEATGIQIAATAPLPGAGAAATIADNTCTDLDPGQSCTATLLLSGQYTGDADGSLAVSSNGGAVVKTIDISVDVFIPPMP
jgi:hypothetical protein